MSLPLQGLLPREMKYGETVKAVEENVDFTKTPGVLLKTGGSLGPANTYHFSDVGFGSCQLLILATKQIVEEHPY